MVNADDTTERPRYQPQELPHIAELRAVLDALDASELLAELHGYRRRAYGWRAVGRRGHGPGPLWRSCVAAFHLNLSSTNALKRRLQEDPALKTFCGFKGVLPHRTTFNRFVQRLSGHTKALASDFAQMTERLKECLPDLGDEVAIDATVVHAYGNPKKGSDPDASWTAKANHHIPDTKEWHYGYKLHLMVDSRYEVPLSMIVTTAKRNDTKELEPLVEQAEASFSWFKPHAASADKGYDSQTNHEFLYNRGTLPIIGIREKKSTPESLGIFTKDGIPTCLGNKPMVLAATDGNGRRLYRCPGRGCPLKTKRPGGVNYCDTEFWLDPRENLRLCGANRAHQQGMEGDQQPPPVGRAGLWQPEAKRAARWVHPDGAAGDDPPRHDERGGLPGAVLGAGISGGGDPPLDGQAGRLSNRQTTQQPV